MREIKFRAWDKENNKFLDLEWNDYYLDIDCGELYEIEERSANYQTYMHKRYLGNVVLQQWTGLTDRNGKEIYEGDRLLIDGEQELDYGHSFDWKEEAVVRWNDEELCFYLDVTKKREVNLCEDGYFTVDTFPLRKWSEGEWGIEYEIIGTIYENPELLE